MTQIIFDIKRDNGYGTQVYLPGRIAFNPSNRGLSANPPMGFSVPLGGPVVIELQVTDDSFWWDVIEYAETNGGTPTVYKRSVMVPLSEEPINFLDLPDVDFSLPYSGQNGALNPIPSVE